MKTFIASALLLVLCTKATIADDGAASIGAGGIILMKREPRIAMAKEILTISLTKILVDYEFRNDSDEDIATEVAFPIPSYSFPRESDMSMPAQQGFDDFRLWIEDKPAKFTTEARAFIGKRDITTLLERMRVDVGSFGHYGNGGKKFGELPYFSRDIDRLNVVQRRDLVSAKIISNDSDKEPLWRVEKKYHWQQTFPAHGVIHIRHEYTPVLGNSNTAEGSDELKSVCPTRQLLNIVDSDFHRPNHAVGIEYVDFILTTANTWKQPIEDFSLIVERPSSKSDPNHPATAVNLVSFCWDGPVEKTDATHFRAHLTNFIPSRELRVGFLAGYIMPN